MIQTGADSQHSAITNTLPGDTELRQLANAMPQLVWIAGPDGRVSFYNDRVAEFAGAHRQEFR